MVHGIIVRIILMAKEVLLSMLLLLIVIVKIFLFALCLVSLNFT